MFVRVWYGAKCLDGVLGISLFQELYSGVSFILENKGPGSSRNGSMHSSI